MQYTIICISSFPAVELSHDNFLNSSWLCNFCIGILSLSSLYDRGALVPYSRLTGEGEDCPAPCFSSLFYFVFYSTKSLAQGSLSMRGNCSHYKQSL